MKSIKKYFSLLLIIFLFFSTNKDAYSKVVNKIIVKIDGNIITSLDLQNDVAIFLYLNNLELNKKNINSSKERVLKNLIDRKIKINEINKNNVERYSALDVSTFIAKIAQGKNLTFKEFKSEFKKRGIDYLAFENSIKVIKRHKLDLSDISLIKINSANKTSNNFADQLQVLTDLFNKGSLTKEEFAKAKKKLLN